MEKTRMDRREFFFRTGRWGLAGLGGLALLGVAGTLAACGGKDDGSGAAAGADKKPAGTSADPCNDTSALTSDQIAVRGNFDYVPDSTTPEETCANCEFFQPAAQGRPCAGCTIVPGPIRPGGWCDSWSEATAG